MATLARFRGHRCCTAAASRHLSTVHRGVAFEQRALELLREHFSMSLTRVGGRGDGGIDLLGWWWLPTSTSTSSVTSSSTHCAIAARDATIRRRIRVVGQCKAEKKKMGPNYVRELEGVMYRLASPSPKLPLDEDTTASLATSLSSSEADSSSQDEPAVAILVSQSPFTKSTILRAQSSPIPFLLLHLPLQPAPTSDSTSTLGSESTISPLNAPTPETPQNGAQVRDGSIATALCNMALAGTRGLLRGEMEVRWERDLEADGGSLGLGVTGRPGLWWKGERLQSWVPQEDPNAG